MRSITRSSLLPVLFLLGGGPSSPTDPPARIEIPAAGVEVPMHRLENLPAVDVSIDGRGPYRLVVDWGANLLAVSPRVAAELKLPSSGIDRMGNENVRIDSLAIGGARLGGLTAAVDPFFAGRAEQGVLGVNVFREILLTLDYPRGRIRLEKGLLPPPDGKRILACDSADGPEPAIEITLAGRPIRAMLDTGAGRLLMLPEALMGGLPLGPLRAAGEASGPQGGASRLKEAPLKGDLRLCDVVVHDPILSFHPRPRAFLGGALLERFAVTLDQKGHRVRFTGKAEPRPRVSAVP